ncbi:hypothetical protein FQZ97_1093390 [compost metagenome]
MPKSGASTPTKAAMYSSRGTTFRRLRTLACASAATGAVWTSGSGSGGGASSTSSITGSMDSTSTSAPARSKVTRYFSAVASSRLFLRITRLPEKSMATRLASAWNSLAMFACTSSSCAPATSFPEKAIS